VFHDIEGILINQKSNFDYSTIPLFLPKKLKIKCLCMSIVSMRWQFLAITLDIFIYRRPDAMSRAVFLYPHSIYSFRSTLGDNTERGGNLTIAHLH